MAEEELDLLFPRPPFLQMLIHHVLEGDRSLCRDREFEEKESRLISLDPFAQYILLLNNILNKYSMYKQYFRSN